MKRLKGFVENSCKRVFILKGYAGTGKTTLMQGLIKWLNEKEKLYALLASTGRAAKILSDKTGTLASTVHSHIYNFSDLDDDLEAMAAKNSKLGEDHKGKINLLFELKVVEHKTEKIYIIDEASMIGDVPDRGSSFASFGSGRLLNDLLNFDKRGRFIFVGDPVQLPPISQPFSPALSMSYFQENYRQDATEFELTEIIRQGEDSGIITISMKLRKLHALNPPGKWAFLPLKAREKGIRIHHSLAGLLDAYLQTIRTEGFGDATLICQTNRKCGEMNALIRKALGMDKGHIMPGEILLVTQNNYRTGFLNGDIIRVLQTGNREKRCGLSFVEAEVESLHSGNHTNVLIIEDILYSNSTNISTKQHTDLMIDYSIRMRDDGYRQKDLWFKENMMYDPYLNGLRSVYGYAITCHKGQGGEWKQVFLYIDNYIQFVPRPGVYQWLYTAVTRARNILHIADDWFIK